MEKRATTSFAKKSAIFMAGMLFFAIVFSARAAFAQADTFGVTQVGSSIGLGGGDIRIIVTNIIRAVLGVLGLVAVSIVIYGGYLYMTAGGEEEKVATARKLLVNGLIGLAIILSAFSIVQFVLSRLSDATGSGSSDTADNVFCREHPDDPTCLDASCQQNPTLSYCRDRAFYVKSITPSAPVGTPEPRMNNIAIRALFSRPLSPDIDLSSALSIAKDGLEAPFRVQLAENNYVLEAYYTGLPDGASATPQIAANSDLKPGMTFGDFQLAVLDLEPSVAGGAYTVEFPNGPTSNRAELKKDGQRLSSITYTLVRTISGSRRISYVFPGYMRIEVGVRPGVTGSADAFQIAPAVFQNRFIRVTGAYAPTDPGAPVPLPRGSYRVSVNTSVVDVSGKTLDANYSFGGETYPATATFAVTALLEDREAPVLQPVLVNGSSDRAKLYIGDTFIVESVVRDVLTTRPYGGTGIAYLDIVEKGTATAAGPRYYSAPRILAGSAADFLFKITTSVSASWFTPTKTYVATVKAFDVDGNSNSASAEFTVYGAHCQNGAADYDLGETGVDSGGACGGGEGDACTEDAQCSGWQKCVSNRCAKAPVILQVNPWNGAPGNWITLSGQNFGANTGIVEFGIDANRDGVVNPERPTGEAWLTATEPLCPAKTSWQPSWAIAEVPALPGGSLFLLRISPVPANGARAVVVEDGEDGNADGWEVETRYGSVSAATDEGRRVIAVENRDTFPYAHPTLAIPAPARDRSALQIDFKFTKRFEFIVEAETDDASQRLKRVVYTTTDRPLGLEPRRELQAGDLPPELQDGQWHTITLRVAEDIKRLFPWVRTVSLSSIIINLNGRGYVDDVTALDVSPLILTDTTGDAFGPRPGTLVPPRNELFEGYFTKNTIVRPGVCAAVVDGGAQDGATAGAPETDIRITGRAFGSREDTVTFGSVEGDVRGFGGWTDSRINTNVPRNMNAGTVSVAVSAGGETSNAVPFTVLPAGDAGQGIPVIEAIDPNETTDFSYVTIRGRNFGTVSNAVYLTRQQGLRCTDNDVSRGACIQAKTILACGSNWTDTEIIFEAADTAGRALEHDTEYFVVVKNANRLANDARMAVTVIDGAPRPGICAINPPSGPAPLPDTAQPIRITGANFGANPVLYYWKKDSTEAVSTWLRADSGTMVREGGSVRVLQSVSPREISTRLPVSNGVSMQTGPIKVQTDGGVSNGVTYTVTDCTTLSPGNIPSGFRCCASDKSLRLETSLCPGETRDAGYVWRFTTGRIPDVPHVAESCDATNFPSPTPWAGHRTSPLACLNATVAVRFAPDDIRMDASSLNVGTVKMYACDTEGDRANCDGARKRAVPADQLDISYAAGANILTIRDASQDVSSPPAVAPESQIGAGVRFSGDLQIYGVVLEPSAPSGIYRLAFGARPGGASGAMEARLMKNDEIVARHFFHNLDSILKGEQYDIVFSGYLRIQAGLSSSARDSFVSIRDMFEVLSNKTIVITRDFGRGALEPNTWYRVELGIGIRAVTTRNVLGVATDLYEPLQPSRTCGAGTAYCFDFKTDGAGARCVIRDASIAPPTYTARELGPISVPPGSDNPLYYVLWGRSDRACQVVSADQFGWVWSATGSNRAAATVTRDPDAASRATAEALSPAPEGTLFVHAAAADIYNNVIDADSTLSIELGTPKVDSMWPKCNEACTNADIGMTFTRDMMFSTYRGNVQLFRCANELCLDAGLTELPLGSEQSGDATLRQYRLRPANGLEMNSSYLVRVTAGVKSVGQFEKQDGNLVPKREGVSVEPIAWTFRTRSQNGECAIDSVRIEPSLHTARAIGEKTRYEAVPKSAPDACSPAGQELNGWAYGWRWETDDTAVATVTNFSSPRAGSSPFCGNTCLPSGSDYSTSTSPVAVCGNGMIDPGEDCDIASNGETAGVSCALNCTRPGSSAATCGNGAAESELGEECDPGGDKAGWTTCSARCTNLGAGTVASNTPGVPWCGSGTVSAGSGKECDIKDSATQAGCSDRCLRIGSDILSQSWCDSHAGESLCGRAASVCGNGLLESGETCEFVSGNQSSIIARTAASASVVIGVGNAFDHCTAYCTLKNICSDSFNGIPNAGSGGIRCTANVPGCTPGCTLAGSSVLYTQPSLCGDAVNGTGEYAWCEASSPSTGAGANPVQVVSAVGLGIVKEETKKQETTVLSYAEKAVNPDGTSRTITTKSDSGKYELLCGYTEFATPVLSTEGVPSYNDCPGGSVSSGVASNSCCYPRAVREAEYPADGAGIGGGMPAACPNTAISVRLSGIIDQSSIAGNIIIAKGFPSGHACDASTEIDVSERVRGALLVLGNKETPKGFWVRVWHALRSFASRLFGDPAEATRFGVGSISVWCSGSAAGVPTITPSESAGTTISISLTKFLDTNSTYAVILKGGKSGIRDTRGVGIRAKDSARTLDDMWVFRTLPDRESCKMSTVTLSPAEYVFTAPNTSNFFSAKAWTASGANIQPVPGQYDWIWEWGPANHPIFAIPKPGTSTSTGDIQIASKTVEGEATVVARAHVIADTEAGAGNQLGRSFPASSELRARFCERSWPSRETAYEDATYHFSMEYCADAGVSGRESDDLPFLSIAGTPLPDKDPDELVKLLFTDTSGVSDDAIGIRIFRNPDRLLPADWYAKKFADATSGAVRPDKAGGYAAVADGDTYYINFLNQSGGTIHNNIMVVSLSAGADAAMRQVFDALLDSLRFNTELADVGYCLREGANLKTSPADVDLSRACVTDFDCRDGAGDARAGLSGTCSNAKTKFLRDWQRLQDIKFIQDALRAYSQNNGGAYPALRSGTFIPNYTVAYWPSWGKELSAALKVPLPQDRVNRKAACGDPAADPETCWNSAASEYSCPGYSSVYEYEYLTTTLPQYMLHGTLEYFGIGDTIVSQFVSTANFTTTPWCLKGQKHIPSGGRCGDGAVNPGEQCDPPGSMNMSTVGQYTYLDTETLSGLCSAANKGADVPCMMDNECPGAIIPWKPGSRTQAINYFADDTSVCVYQNGSGPNLLVHDAENQDKGIRYAFGCDTDTDCRTGSFYAGKMKKGVDGKVATDPPGGTAPGGEPVNGPIFNSGDPAYASKVTQRNRFQCKGLIEIGISSLNLGDSVSCQGVRTVTTEKKDVGRCPANGTAVSTCTPSCTITPGQCTVNATCGNGRVEGDETCDEGGLNGSYGHCDAKDQRADDTATPPNESLGCRSRGAAGLCGNGALDAGKERCDTTYAAGGWSGYAVNKEQSCSWDCQTYGGYCGDGITQSSGGGAETCDDGNAVSGDGCSNLCKTEDASSEPDDETGSAAAGSCGDGIVQEGVNAEGVIERCDLGSQNGIACRAEYGRSCTYCSADCRNILTVDPMGMCGNGVIDRTNPNAPAGAAITYEACDVMAQGTVVSTTAVAGVVSGFKVGPTCDDTYYKDEDDVDYKGSIACSADCRKVTNTCVACGTLTGGGATPKIAILNVLTPNSAALNTTWADETVKGLYRRRDNTLYGASNWRIVSAGTYGGRTYPTTADYRQYTRPQWLFVDSYYFPQESQYLYTSPAGATTKGLQTSNLCNGEYRIIFNHAEILGALAESVPDDADLFSLDEYVSIYDNIGAGAVSHFDYPVNGESREVRNEYVITPAVKPAYIRAVVRWPKNELNMTLVGVLYNQSFTELSGDQRSRQVDYLRALAADETAGTGHVCATMKKDATSKKHWIPGDECRQIAGFEGVYVHDMGSLNTTYAQAMTIGPYTDGRKTSYAFFVESPGGFIGSYRGQDVKVDVYDGNENRGSAASAVAEYAIYKPTHTFSIKQAAGTTNATARYWHVFNLVYNETSGLWEIKFVKDDVAANPNNPELPNGIIETGFQDVKCNVPGDVCQRTSG